MTLTEQSPKKIYLWSTEVKAVYKWTVKVRPTVSWNWDLTQATLTSANQISGYLVYWVAMSDDGTKFYYQTNNWNRQTGTFHQFTLTTPFDISTKTSEVTFSIGSSSAQWWVYPWNIVFRNGGRYLYITYWNSTAPLYIERYTLSTPRDVSTKTLTNQITDSSSDGWSVYITEDGAKEYYSWSGGLRYKQLTTQYVPETANILTSTVYDFPWLSSDGKYIYTDGGSTITQYSLSTERDVTTATQVATLSKPTSANYSYWIYFNSDGTKLRTIRWLVNNNNVYTYTIS